MAIQGMIVASRIFSEAQTLKEWGINTGYKCINPGAAHLEQESM